MNLPQSIRTEYPFVVLERTGFSFPFLLGTYRLGKKLTAYRTVQCASCGQPEVALRYREWRFIHVYFIPVLPVATQSPWTCLGCGEDAYLKKDSLASPMLSFIFLVFPILLLLSMVFAGVTTSWTDCGVAAAAALFVLWVFFRWARAYQARVQSKVEASAPPGPTLPDVDHCIVCQGKMAPASTWSRRCSACGIEHQEVSPPLPDPR